VVPLTPSLGLIEWVRNTTTLKDFLVKVNKQIYKSQDDVIKKAQGIKQDIVAEIGKQKKDEQFSRFYSRVAPIFTPTELSKIQRRSEAPLPWDLLRRGLEALARSPEAFVYLQTQWTASLAAMSAAHYILGIGDRHPKNMLIDTSTAGVVGIDFGYSFGVGVQFLPVPELVPFRLTRQMRNVFLPLEVSAGKVNPFATKMARCLAAWRNHASTIASVADVFVNEPSADWEYQANKILESKGDPQRGPKDDVVARVQFYPKEKVKILRRKLNGAHPVIVLKDEIEARINKERKQEWKKIAQGFPTDVRSSVPATPGSSLLEVVSSSDQVKCLIDLATDDNILGRLWIGWEAHI